MDNQKENPLENPIDIPIDDETDALLEEIISDLTGNTEEAETPELSQEAQAWLDELLGNTSSLSAPEAAPVPEPSVDAIGRPDQADPELEQLILETLAEDFGMAEPDVLPDPFAAERESALLPEADSASVFPESGSMDGTQMFIPLPETEVVEETPVPVEAVKETPEVPAPAPAKTPKAAAPNPFRRQKNKDRAIRDIPHIFSAAIWFGLIVVIGISLGRIAWVCAADLLAFGKPDSEVTITITEDDDISSIAQKLGDAELVRYPNLFKFFATITGKADEINPGTYTLNSKYDYNAMIKIMGYTGSSWDDIEILIPEGYNCAQIFQLLADEGVCSIDELEEWAASGELDDYWFLEGVPRGNKYCLEGYLYPDTYRFFKDDDPRRVLEKFLDNFNVRFTDRMKKDFATLKETYAARLAARGYSSAYIAENQLTVHKLLTLASIIEEESADYLESYDISSVFFNRLTNPGNFPRLDSDATVYYAIGAYFERHELTQKELDYDSPYNTRKSNGLPPGPISNPGSYSLYAALYPSDSGYYYFIFDEEAGCHRFSKTLAEHQDWINKLG